MSKRKAENEVKSDYKRLKSEIINEINQTERKTAKNPNNGNNKKKNRNNKKNNNNNNGSRNYRTPMGPIAKNDSSTILQHAAPQLDDIIEKDEFVADVLGSGGVGLMNLQTFPINPAQPTTFPLGSAEANKWTHWKAISVEPYLLHEVSEFATDGSTGKVYLACDYNAANAIPTTKQQLADMHSASCMPCQDVGLKLKPKLLNRADPKYIRVGNLPPHTDIRLYDGGNLYVAAIGQAGNTKISELRIRYKFKLCLPTLLNAGGNNVELNTSVSSFQSTTGTEVSGATGVNKLVLFGTTVTNPLNIVNSAGTFTPPAGNYLVDFQYNASCNANNITIVSADIQKNGTTVFIYAPTNLINAGSEYSIQNGTSGITAQSGALKAFISANGTDAFTFPVAVSFSAGACAIAGQTIWQSVA